MENGADELKVRAARLLKRARAGEPDALSKLEQVGRFDPGDGRPQLRHCLSVVARDSGFDGYPHAREVLTSTGPCEDWGRLLCPPRCTGITCIWSRDYDEAHSIRGETGGYLLGFRRDLFIADAGYIESLGLRPDDPRWSAIGFDWVRPREPALRVQLYLELLRGEPRRAA